MTSIIKADNISTVSGSGNITIPTGVKVVGTDAASIYAPGLLVQLIDATGTGETNVTANNVWTATNAVVSITPKFTNSKIYLSHTAGGLTEAGSSYGDRGIRIQRAISGGATTLIHSSQRYGYTSTSTWVPMNWAVIDVDAGYNTTSQLTYTIEIYKGGTGGTARHCDTATWTFVAMEIAQ